MRSMGRPIGVPKTGVFGLLDLVGIDLMPHVAASMKATLPETDAYVLGLRDNALITRMIAEGRTGRKGKGGFYSRDKGPGGESLKRALDLTTGDYRASDEAAAGEPVTARPAHDGGTPGPRRRAMPAPCCWTRWAMPRRWCRRSPTASPMSMPPCGSATTGSTGRSS